MTYLEFEKPLSDLEGKAEELRALARKHDVLPDDLATLASELSTRLSALDAGEARLAAEELRQHEAERAVARILGGRQQARRHKRPAHPLHIP